MSRNGQSAAAADPDVGGGSDPLLSVRGLKTHFDTDNGTVRAVDGVSFDVERGETVCVVGESGSGKTVACESVTKLIDMPPGRIAGGEVVFDGEDLAQASEKRLKQIRGGRIGHVFQNPQGALNPVYTVGDQIVEAIRIHSDRSKSEARDRAVELLDRVGIPEAASRADEYPHEFSGGMKQRVVIAMALAGDPDLLIADEPTTALDVTIQAQILRLFEDLQEEFDMSIVFVTHDLGVVAQIADRVVVMYSGKVMERGDVFELFEQAAHPYTQALLRCLPGRGDVSEAIGGSLPDPTNPPDGCRFHPRCPHAVRDCQTGEQPPMAAVDDPADDGDGDTDDRAHRASCVYYRTGYNADAVRETAPGTTGEASAPGTSTGAGEGGERPEGSRVTSDSLHESDGGDDR